MVLRVLVLASAALGPLQGLPQPLKTLQKRGLACSSCRGCCQMQVGAVGLLPHLVAWWGGVQKMHDEKGMPGAMS